MERVLGSKGNALNGRRGIKQDSNENMRAAYYEQVHSIITQDWGFGLPKNMNELWISDGVDIDRAY